MRIFALSFTLVLCASAVRAAGENLELGRALFRSNCAFCHGLNGLGGRGPNLVSGSKKSDDDIKRIIKEGVPGSTMPSFGSFDQPDLDNVVLFIRHLASTSTGGDEKVNGDPAKGRAVYTRNGCAGCHQIGNDGSVYGPELTRVGGARSVSYLRDSLVDPSADIPESYEGVTVVTRDGKRITGVRVNEDTFTVQLRLPSQQFRSFIKDEVKEVIDNKKSLMPAYKNLPPNDLEDLLAYLVSLRGDGAQGTKTKQSEGVH